MLTSNNKVIYIDVLGFIEENLFLHMCSTARFFLLVAQIITGADKGQRGHDVSADRSDKCGQRNLCKENLSNMIWVSKLLA